ncbi:MAG: tRNA (N6-threonylcarbamoyladenosine(37)-N6)-methyltransferase TrmO [Anaerolineales bacterium]|nr:tRNA (N6-threonylcarbamoyladenosine(37)-N6)-methyltransferase TrmO [Anaerolineales bacterium]
MTVDPISFKPIGIIYTQFKEVSGMPIQPAGALGVPGTVEVFPSYEPGLADLDGFSHILLIYLFHQVNNFQLTVTPFLDSEPRGVFATRAPKRPNPIGISVVKLLAVEGRFLKIENVDILDGTPLLDIKPFIPDFDQFEVEKLGWYNRHQRKVGEMRSDQRFKE